MLGKYDQVLNIHDAVAPEHRANIAQGVILMSVFGHDHNIFHINDSVAAKVNDGIDRDLP